MDHGRVGVADGLRPLWTDPPLADAASADASREARERRPTRHLLVLPSADDPRLVLPAGPGRAAATVLHTLRDESTPAARAKSWLIRGAATLRLRATRLPDPPLLAVVAEHLSPAVAADDLVYGVHLGPPRANRKPVLALASRDGRLLAIAKWGTNALTDRLVAHEGEALAALAALPADSGVTVPRLLGAGELDGHPYVVQSPVPTTGAGRWSPARAADAQVAVATSGGHEDADRYLRLLQSTCRTRPQTVDPRDRDSAEQLRVLADAWLDRVRQTALPHGRWHGDWRRTNMALTAQTCAVWDWERFDSGVPLGYDALHLHLTSRAGGASDLSALPRELLRQAPGLLAPFGVAGRDDAELVACGYLVELAGRYLDDGQSRSGARLGAVGSWLLPTLADVLDAPATAPSTDNQGEITP